jgi:hypothetical protein
MDMGNLDAEQWYPDAAPHQQPPLAGELTSSYDDSSSLYSDEVGLGGDYGVTASVTQPMKLDDDSFFRLVLDGVIVPILYGLITIVGAAGNMLVIYVIVAKPRMRTVTNLLLLSLACADLAFVLVVPPFTAYQNATSNWPFGDVACRLMHYMVNVAAYVTVYTLVVIAGLRYATVVHGVRTARYRTKRNATAAAATIWAVVLAVNVPILMSYHVVEITGCLVCDINEAQVRQLLWQHYKVRYVSSASPGA